MQTNQLKTIFTAINTVPADYNIHKKILENTSMHIKQLLCNVLIQFYLDNDFIDLLHILLSSIKITDKIAIFLRQKFEFLNDLKYLKIYKLLRDDINFTIKLILFDCEITQLEYENIKNNLEKENFYFDIINYLLMNDKYDSIQDKDGCRNIDNIKIDNILIENINIFKNVLQHNKNLKNSVFFNDLIENVEKSKNYELLNILIDERPDDRIKSILDVIINNVEITKKVVDHKILDREELRFVFNEYVYLDVDLEKRYKIFDVLGNVIQQYNKMDVLIRRMNYCKEENESIKRIEMNDKNTKKICLNDEEEYIENTSEIEDIQWNEKIKNEHYGTINNDNSRVMAAKLWPELKTIKHVSILPILNKIIESTDNFYSNRIQSKYIEELTATFRTKTEEIEKFIILLNRKLYLKKETFELIAKLVIELQIETEDVIESLIEQDFYFLFYLIYIKKIDASNKINIIIKKMLKTRKIVDFLEKIKINKTTDS